MKIKKILFVCKQNRFRSQIAEQFFKKYNKNKNISAKSAGIFKGLYPLDKTEMDVAKSLRVNINKKPRNISVDFLKDMDLVVIVADDVPQELFLIDGKYLQKIIKWDINDEYEGDVNDIKRIIGKIEKNVKNLIKQLDKGELK